jgi:hypothetical protein
VSHLAGALVGVLCGLAALAVHRSGLAWLALAVVVSVAVPVLLRGTNVPRAAASYCLGWLVVFGIAVAGRREGDYVLAGDLAGYTLMGTAFVLVAVGVSALPDRRPRRT